MEFADGISLMIKLLVLTTGQYMAEHIIFVLIYVIRDQFVWSCHNDTDPWNTIKAKVNMDRLVVLSCTVKITINDNTLVTHIASPHFVNENGVCTTCIWWYGWCESSVQRISLQSHRHCFLTHWGRAKIDTTLQTTFSIAISWMKMFEFRLKFLWGLFLKVQLTIFQH